MDLPKEIRGEEEFKNLIEGSSELRVIRRGDVAKLKLRRKKLLYVHRTTSKKADGLLKDVKVDVVEL